RADYGTRTRAGRGYLGTGRLCTVAAVPGPSLLPERGHDVVHRVLHGVQVPEVFVVDAEPDRSLPELLFERLDELDERERVGVEVLGEVRLELDAVLVDLEDLRQPLAQDAVDLVGADRPLGHVRLSRHLPLPSRVPP